MAKEVRVTPWISHQEWQSVKNSIIEQKLQAAKDHIEIWKSRTFKLDAGVETTHCLLESILMETNESAHALALSASINRFLNLITHAGMNMFNLSKYYDVAKCLAIPRWIVDVRHDTSHGQMPGYEVLKSAVAFCFKWLVVNYWQYEDYSEEPNLENYEFIHEMLDCYKNLKIYAIWGNKKLSEIKDQKEIHDQIFNFVTALKKSNEDGPPKKKRKKVQNTENTEFTIHDCVVYLRNQIEKIVRHQDPEEIEAILKSLCNDQLLVPDEELVKSLCEPKDDQFLPKNLMKVWSDILSIISQAGLLPNLLEKFVVVKHENSFCEKVGSAWTSKLLYQISKKSNGLIKISAEDQNQEKWNEFIENYILSGNPSMCQNLNLLSNIRDPPLTSEQMNKLKKIHQIYHENVSISENQIEIKSVDDISPENSIGIWKRLAHDDIIFGQSDIDFNFKDESKIPEWLDDCDEDVVSLDWYYLSRNSFNKL